MLFLIPELSVFYLFRIADQLIKKNKEDIDDFPFLKVIYSWRIRRGWQIGEKNPSELDLTKMKKKGEQR